MWDEFLRNDQQRIYRVCVINSLLHSATVGCIDHFQVAGNEVELRTQDGTLIVSQSREDRFFYGEERCFIIHQIAEAQSP